MLWMSSPLQRRHSTECGRYTAAGSNLWNPLPNPPWEERRPLAKERHYDVLDPADCQPNNYFPFLPYKSKAVFIGEMGVMKSRLEDDGWLVGLPGSQEVMSPPRGYIGNHWGKLILVVSWFSRGQYFSLGGVLEIWGEFFQHYDNEQVVTGTGEQRPGMTKCPATWHWYWMITSWTKLMIILK